MFEAKHLKGLDGGLAILGNICVTVGLRMSHFVAL